MLNALASLLVTSALLSVSACGAGGGADSPRHPSSEPSASATASSGGATCAPVESRGELLVVDWEPLLRGDLELMMKESIGILRHDCNGVRVLKSCRVDGSYAFSSMTRAENVLQLTSAEEMKKTLPSFGQVLATKVEWDMERGRSVDIATVMIGSLATARTSVRRTELSGDCRDATHFVPRATLGAFALEIGSRERVRTVREIMGATVQTSSSSAANLMARDGSIADCAQMRADAQHPPPQCRAFVRLELRRLTD